MGQAELKLINMSDVAVEEIDWLWYPFIPYGKITILQGDPGEGKTTLMLHLISELTRGTLSPFSEGDSNFELAVNVIYQTAEDGLGDTIKPRLLVAGADCSKVLVIDDSEKALSINDDRLEEAIAKTNARLIVLDPLQGYLGANVDMHRANEIRPLMHRLSVIAEKYKSAIVLIGHMNKSTVTKSGYRGLGSIDIQAAARSVLLCGRVKESPEIRAICQIKSSLAPEASPVAFRLGAEEGFEWIGEYDITAEELLTGDAKGSKTRRATAFLKDKLASGKVAAVDIEAAAKQSGIKDKTLRNAKKELSVDSKKICDKWYWEMKTENEDGKIPTL